VAVEVHGEDAHRARRYLRVGVLDGDGVRVVDVHEDRGDAGEAHRLHGGEGGVGGQENLVALQGPERLEGQPQGGGGVGGEHGVPGPVVGGELPLEGLALGTGSATGLTR
jgi:hypothetical protein